MGADGGVNALSHAFTPDDSSARRPTPWPRGDLERARRHQRETIDPAFEFCCDHGFAPSMKAALAHQGRIDSRAVRPPQDSLDSQALDELGTVLD